MESNMPGSPASSMGMRGVTRGSHDMGKPYTDQRFKMLEMHHKQTLWVYWMLVLLGFWMLVAPFTFGYQSTLAQPAGGREVWLSLDQRAIAMQWSDVLSGALLVIFGWRSLSPNRPYSLWICCFIGIWLTFAPILFWAPKAVTYLNDTFVGAWIIGLTVLIAGMPNMMLFMEMGASIPAGWSYNPSSWPQRWIMIVTGFLGWIVIPAGRCSPWLPNMLKAIHNKGYQAPPIRRVHIPKPGKSEKRPIGVPTVSDRALQKAVCEVLSPIYESDFLSCSYGGRPGKSAHMALSKLRETIFSRKVLWILEADLKNFFGSMDHRWIMTFMQERVADPRIVVSAPSCLVSPRYAAS